MLGGNKKVRYLFMLIATSAYSLKIHYFVAWFWRERWHGVGGMEVISSATSPKYIANIWILFQRWEIVRKLLFFTLFLSRFIFFSGGVTSFLIKFSQNFICVLGALNRFPLICGRGKWDGWRARIKSRKIFPSVWGVVE